MDLAEWRDLIPVIGIIVAAVALWLTLGRGGGKPPAPPVGPSGAQTADREARAVSLEKAVEDVGPHTDEVDSDDPTDVDVDGWIEAKD